MNARRAPWLLLWAAVACLPSEDLSEYSSERAAGGGAGSAALGAAGNAGAGVTDDPQLAAGGSVNEGGVGNGELPLDGSGGVSGVAPVDQGSAGAGLAGAGGTASPAPDPAFAECEDGVTSPDGSICYLVSEQTATWQVARTACVAWQGALVEVADADEDAFLDSLMTASIWLGGSDTLFDNVFVWTDGSPIVFGNWGPQQPDRFPGPDCVEKRFAPGGSLWFDQPCDNQRAYVCEKPLTPSAAP